MRMMRIGRKRGSRRRRATGNELRKMNRTRCLHMRQGKMSFARKRRWGAGLGFEGGGNAHASAGPPSFARNVQVGCQGCGFREEGTRTRAQVLRGGRAAHRIARLGQALRAACPPRPAGTARRSSSARPPAARAGSAPGLLHARRGPPSVPCTAQKVLGCLTESIRPNAWAADCLSQAPM